MYFKYGNFQHPDNQVNLVSHTEEHIRSQRGKPYLLRKRQTLDGYIKGATQAEIKTKIEALENAYELEGRDAGLYHDDGTRSPHFLDSSAAIGGVKILTFGYDRSDGSQYATQRNFSITLQADFPAGNVGLLYYEETLEIIGTGQFAHVVIPLIEGPPDVQQVYQFTPVRARQNGRAVGFLGYPLITAPQFPQWEKLAHRRISRTTPRVDSGSLVEFKSAWSYFFESPGSLSGFPRSR